MNKIEGELEVARNRAGGLPQASLEEEEIEQQCEAMQQELDSEYADIAQLRDELKELQEATKKFHSSLTTACFDEVQRAEARVEALESVVSQLDAGPVDEAKVSAIVAQLDAAAAARAATIAARPSSPNVGAGTSQTSSALTMQQ